MIPGVHRFANEEVRKHEDDVRDPFLNCEVIYWKLLLSLDKILVGWSHLHSGGT